MLSCMQLLLLGAFLCGYSCALNNSTGLCGQQNGGISSDPILFGNGTPSCCGVNGSCGWDDAHCLVSNGCQLNCTGFLLTRVSSAKSTGMSIGDIVGLVGVALAMLGLVFQLFVLLRLPWKTGQALRRPLDLIELYGYSGIFVLLLGNQTTWRTEAYVLGKVNDEDALSFKKSVQDECTMISVAAAIVAQISVTSLSLDNLSQTHWIARALIVFSAISSLMAVYYATTQQRTMGRLLQPQQVRGWIRGQLPPQKMNSIWKYKPASRRRSDPEHYEPLQSDSSSAATKDLMRSCFIPSAASVVTMSAPQILLSVSLLTLILGIGVYFGFTWTRHLDTEAQKSDSRNVMITFLVSTVVCFMVYSLSRLIQDNDPSTEKTILLEYIKEYAEKHPQVASRWRLEGVTPVENSAVELVPLMTIARPASQA